MLQIVLLFIDILYICKIVSIFITLLEVLKFYTEEMRG